MLELSDILQKFPAEKIDDVRAAVRAEMAPFASAFPAKSSVAIAVGSRGIDQIATIVTAVVDQLKMWDVRPWIVPAMGSHGNASAEGQREVLAGYGIRESIVGAPVRASMDVIELDRGDLPHPIFQDRIAYEADAVIVINRVKEHTDYHEKIESGLLKMCVIGLGKHRQAQIMHRYGVAGLRDGIPPAARQILRQGKIRLGLGIVENAYDQPLKIKAAAPQDMQAVEEKLLQLCREHMPRLPLDKIDLLIVDRMGKDISGTGLDTNIIGRRLIRGEAEPSSPDISRIAVCGLTPDSHGNAIGVGLADIITRRLHDQIDFAATYENVLTSTFTERGKIPLIADSDRQAVEWAMRTWGPVPPQDAIILRIRDTLHLSQMQASSAALAALKNESRVETIAAPQGIFDEDGHLLPMPPS